jgi:hypothetical protein
MIDDHTREWVEKRLWILATGVAIAVLVHTGMKSCERDPAYLDGVAAQAAVAEVCFDEFTSSLSKVDALEKQRALYRTHTEEERRAMFIGMLKSNRGYFPATKLKFDYIAPCMEKFLEVDFGK